MNDARKTKIDQSGPLRAQRGAVGVVAQYVHDLSGRHGLARRPLQSSRPRLIGAPPLRPVDGEVSR